MNHVWRDGYHHPKDLEAATVAKALENVRKRRGAITPEVVVEAARRSTSPLHRVFEWDDSVAAHEYRLAQARNLIAAVYVRDEGPEGPREVRAYAVVSMGGARRYEDMETVLSSDELRLQVLARAFRELEQWERRYRDLTELAEVFEAAGRTRAMKAAS